MTHNVCSLITATINTEPGFTAPDFAGFSFVSLDGEFKPLCAYLGKVVLIVNVASRCGFRGQYEGLTRLYNKYRAQGLEIIAVPCDDFRQEPGTASDIKRLAINGYQVEFPLMQKSSVRGHAAHPFYEWAKARAKYLGLGTFMTRVPRWNFHKYLISRDGDLIDSFSTLVGPHSAALVAAIEAALD